MPRRPRLVLVDVPLHVIQRGNNRTDIFRDSSDFARYQSLLDDGRRRTGCAMHAYALMTNHVHLLVTPPRPDAISQMMKWIGERYVRYYNDRYQRTGTLWEGRFRSAMIDSDRYFFACSRYIELNPVRAGMVGHPGDYAWSSFRTNGLAATNSLLQPHPLYLHLGTDPMERAAAYSRLVEATTDSDSITAIRRSIKSGTRITESDPGV
jgi:putative transposase